LEVHRAHLEGSVGAKELEYGTWGGEIRSEFEPKPGEIVATEHWCCGFANTDLDLQLKKHGIHQLIVIGLIAHTCIEATVRFAAELGYEVTVVKDATADYSGEEMHAALDIKACIAGRWSVEFRRRFISKRCLPSPMMPPIALFSLSSLRMTPKWLGLLSAPKRRWSIRS
jgi:nicotinamidase-related amidase